MPLSRKPAPTVAPIHDILRHRWSPRAFANRPVEREKLHSLFEAARWASSSYNAQPWYFIVATKDDPANYKKVLDCFVEFNQGWAGNAPAIAISIAHLTFDDGRANRHAFHDVGQAAANLALEAVAQGLQIHQMAGIVAGIAIGYEGDPESLTGQLKDRENAPRARKPLGSFVFTRTWGEASRIVE
jgi:nitroreductase